MRRIILALAISSGILSLSLMAADACGDKSLRIGRGARFQRTMRPAAILVYLPPRSPVTVAAKAPQFQSMSPQLQSLLKKAGHKPYAVEDAGQLSEALKSGQYDLILTDLADAATLQKQIESSSSKPVVVPVGYKLTKAEAGAAKKQYQYLVKNPGSADEYLDAIDEAMKSKMVRLQRKG